MTASKNKREIYDSEQYVSPMVEEYVAVKKYKFILRRLIITNFKTRYKRSYLGIIWSMLNPLLNMLVFVFVFSFFFKRNIDHYAVYVLTGNMMFAYFRQSTAESMTQMISRAQMMRRIYLPKTTYILSSVGINLINLILTFIPLILVSIFDRLPFHWTVVLIFPCLFLFTLFNIGMSLIVAAIVPYLNDFSQIWNVLMTLWMYMTPIFYPESIIAPQNLKFFRLNPVTVYLNVFRDAYMNGVVSTPDLWRMAIIYAIIPLAIGWFIFTKKSNDFAYRT